MGGTLFTQPHEAYLGIMHFKHMPDLLYDTQHCNKTSTSVYMSNESVFNEHVARLACIKSTICISKPHGIR